MNLKDLLSNENIKNISPEKLNFLMEFSKNNKASSMKDMSSSILNASKEAKSKGIQFSPEETTLLIELLKQNMSKEEQDKVDKMVSIMNNLKKKS